MWDYTEKEEKIKEASENKNSNKVKVRVMVLAIGIEPITSSLPWNCSTVGAMQAKDNNRELTEYVDRVSVKIETKINYTRIIG